MTTQTCGYCEHDVRHETDRWVSDDEVIVWRENRPWICPHAVWNPAEGIDDGPCLVPVNSEVAVEATCARCFHPTDEHPEVDQGEWASLTQGMTDSQIGLLEGYRKMILNYQVAGKERMMTQIGDDLWVGWDMCARCGKYYSSCVCSDGPVPSKVVQGWNREWKEREQEEREA